jgi:hypothetical protein
MEHHTHPRPEHADHHVLAQKHSANVPTAVNAPNSQLHTLNTARHRTCCYCCGGHCGRRLSRHIASPSTPRPAHTRTQARKKKQAVSNNKSRHNRRAGGESSDRLQERRFSNNHSQYTDANAIASSIAQRRNGGERETGRINRSGQASPGQACPWPPSTRGRSCSSSESRSSRLSLYTCQSEEELRMG